MNPIVIDIETVAIADADTYLEPVSAPSNYKDPEKIAAYIAEERARQLDKAALDLDLNRIICLGMKEPGQTTYVMTEYDTPETQMLETLWTTWAGYQNRQPMLVTFNGIGFDVPVLLRRSLYLGIKAPYIQNDRYKHPQQIDLLSVLSMNGSQKYRSLSFYLQRFGYPGATPDVTGKDIGALLRRIVICPISAIYAEGAWNAIAAHCRADVDGTAWLAERLDLVPKGVS